MISDFSFEFRDGERVVPPHIAALIDMAGIDTIRFTYEEAIKLANNGLLKRHLNNAQADVIDSHFKVR